MGTLHIIEGLDGVGKSTLAKFLIIMAPDTPTAHFHAGKPVGTDYLAEYWYPVSFLGKYTVVCDRWHLGEEVWPKLFGRSPLEPNIALLENRMFQTFDEVYGHFLVRDPEGIASCRELNYNPDDAMELYAKAMKYSQIDWDIKTLTDYMSLEDET
jgi:hypothetical protein